MTSTNFSSTKDTHSKLGIFFLGITLLVVAAMLFFIFKQTTHKTNLESTTTASQPHPPTTKLPSHSGPVGASFSHYDKTK